jgi:hypothetical protein
MYPGGITNGITNAHDFLYVYTKDQKTGRTPHEKNTRTMRKKYKTIDFIGSSVLKKHQIMPANFDTLTPRFCLCMTRNAAQKG